jgi:NADPH-dependent 2,4-dienoyl-CoA reductase/sulfur reductase-like enzyme
MLARSGFSGSVTVISQDGDKPYDRTQCSKQYLAGDAARDDCFLEGSALLRGLVIGKKVVALDLSKREVALGDGERVAFDALVLATGSEPKRPDTPGFDRPNVFVLRTLRDADAIIEAAVAGKKAAIVGASFIGLEVAASLRQRKVEVDVVAPGKIPLGKIVGPEVGEMIRGVHEEKGVRFHLGRKAQSFDGRSLVLDDGSALAVDFVVAGVGVTPNTELAEKAGIKVVPEGEGGGLVVDARLQTSAPGVYAVGDIARYPDRYVGKPIRVEHWVHAERQGQHVARVLMGEAEDYADLPFFWSAHFDTGLVYSGHAEDASPAGLDGKIDKQDFMLRLSDTKGGEAILSCGRDVPALQAEADWEKIGKPPAKP